MNQFIDTLLNGDPTAMGVVLATFIAIVGAGWAVWVFWFQNIRKSTSIEASNLLLEILDTLEDKGVLSNPYTWEDRRGVYMSLDIIRKEMGIYLRKPELDKSLREPLKDFQNSCRLVLQDPVIFPEGPNTSQGRISSQIENAVKSLRLKYLQLKSTVEALLPNNSEEPIKNPRATF